MAASCAVMQNFLLDIFERSSWSCLVVCTVTKTRRIIADIQTSGLDDNTAGGSKAHPLNVSGISVAVSLLADCSSTAMQAVACIKAPCCAVIVHCLMAGSVCVPSCPPKQVYQLLINRLHLNPRYLQHHLVAC